MFRLLEKFFVKVMGFKQWPAYIVKFLELKGVQNYQLIFFKTQATSIYKGKFFFQF